MRHGPWLSCAKRERSASWCATRWPKAARRCAASMARVGVSNRDWFQCAGSAKACSRNQACTGVGSMACGASGAACEATAAVALVWATAATAATVWPSINWRGVRRRPRLRARATICNVRMESPPSSKKLSWRPTRSMPNTSAQTAASRVSASPCGASKRSATSGTGCGRALRSTLPLALSGKAASTITATGTM
ncbi:hypothetical protein AQB9606_04714 [Aquabacterium sp. CECT 9606]|nr:hypothetical protein AQB9606_04714 [Aquabacterium sp. CECT 9606]